MQRITKILAGLTLAAGVFGAGAAMANDGYQDESATSYYYTTPESSVEDTAPGTTYNYTTPGTTYYYQSPGSTYSYAPRGYYDNPYNPYWSYQGPLGQGSGHDMRIGR
jgi:hypothetical protein